MVMQGNDYFLYLITELHDLKIPAVHHEVVITLRTTD